MNDASSILKQALEKIHIMCIGAVQAQLPPQKYARVLETMQQMVMAALNEAEQLAGVVQGTSSLPRVLEPERMSVRDILALAEQVPSMEIIQAALTKRYPQGWVLAWTESVTKPPINQSDGRSEVARTEWSDSCAAHGSISQRLGLAVFLKGSIKHNIIRRNA